MRLRRFLMSEPMSFCEAIGVVHTCHIVWPAIAHPRRYRQRVDRGWCNGSTGSFGVPGRGSMPRPRARGPQPHATPRARQEVSAMTQYRPLSAVVLAAGEGTRMSSETPKVL